MIVLDTHAWLWWVSDPSRLSRAAHRRIRTATQIGISAISCLEVATAVTKGRITLDREVLDWLEQALSLPKVELLPLTPLIAVKATQLGIRCPRYEGFEGSHQWGSDRDLVTPHRKRYESTCHSNITMAGRSKRRRSTKFVKS